MGASHTLQLDDEGNLTCCGYACGIPGLPAATTTPFRVLPDVEDFSSRGSACAVFHGRAL
jgi:hypothetical protein